MPSYICRDLITICISMMRTRNEHGIFDIDNIILDDANNESLKYVVDKNISDYPGDLLLYPASLDKLIQTMFPVDRRYPQEFEHFKKMASRVETM